MPPTSKDNALTFSLFKFHKHFYRDFCFYIAFSLVSRITILENLRKRKIAVTQGFNCTLDLKRCSGG